MIDQGNLPAGIEAQVPSGLEPDEAHRQVQGEDQVTVAGILGQTKLAAGDRLSAAMERKCGQPVAKAGRNSNIHQTGVGELR